ncbi:MAG: nickel pincer cofactor biosynthesis protein LarC [candidate division Zixibacteria bacterium]|nr:nickel pincer cofactor biosynthesis protein LarC [candidate division Zixibacteria bacterium]
MKVLYFDLIGGASGDMILGALLDLGLPLGQLKKNWEKLDLQGWKVELEKTERHHIGATRLKIQIPDEKTHRHLSHFKKLLDDSSLSEKIKSQSYSVFLRLAEAEAKVHRTTLEKVHFHEVGGLDTLLDVTGAVIGFDYFGIEKFFSSPFPMGKGSVTTAHGKLPVPPPAVAELVAGFPVQKTDVEAEQVTPTGAALITSLASYESKLSFLTEKVGYGAGAADFKETPNLLRLWLGEQKEGYAGDEVTVLETQIDNTAPELLGFLSERLLDLGALDVYFTPIMMKKNRPAQLLTVLCLPKDETSLTRTIFAETGSIGIRYKSAHRHKLERETLEIDTLFGKLKAKRVFSDGTEKISPEFEDCARVAREKNVPLREVYEAVLSGWRNQNKK